MTQRNQPKDEIRPLRAVESRILETLERHKRPVPILTILQTVNKGRLLERIDILTVYRTVHELKQRGLIILMGDEEVPALSSQLRRHYQLTKSGQKALRSNELI